MKALTMFFCISILMFISSPCAIHSLQPEMGLPLRLQLPQTSGPEDLAFDPKGQGPYTGVIDGRILKFSNGTFVDFATTSPFRTMGKCNGTCERPLGLDFHRHTGELYIAHSKNGILKVGPNGGLATQLASAINGKNFSYIDSIAVDQSTRNVYFVDSGEIFRTNNIKQIVQSGDTSGRLLKYEAATKRVTVVLTGLSGPAGLAFSKDHSFIVITEYIARRVVKHFIRGPKANTTKTMLEKLEGHPDNVKRAKGGGFWTAINIPREFRTDSIALKFDMNGMILERRNVTNGFPNTFSVYLEHFGKAYVASYVADFVGVYPIL